MPDHHLDLPTNHVRFQLGYVLGGTTALFIQETFRFIRRWVLILTNKDQKTATLQDIRERLRERLSSGGLYNCPGMLRMSGIVLLKAIAETVFWLLLLFGIPAALLYPIALWAATRMLMPIDVLTQSYLIGTALLFFPTALLVDFLYRRYFLDRTPKSDHENV